MSTDQFDRAPSFWQRFLNFCHRRGEKKWAKLVAKALTTDDLWRLMERRVPRIVNEYFRGGADDEISLRDSVDAFRQARMTAWGAIKHDSLDLRTSVVGHELAVPWFTCPVGSLCSLWPKADAVVAKVAGEFGTVMSLSTLSGTPMEEVTAASSGKCWFQLYLCGGKEVALRGIARAKKAGFTGLILTIDTRVAGNRAVHARMEPMEASKAFTGLSFGARTELLHRKLSLGPQMLPRLSWLLSHWADGGLMKFVNVQMDEQCTPMPYTDIGKQLSSSAVTWADIPWIKEAWGDGPLIIKGVHNAEDAMCAADNGAAGVIFSIHGGRQSDRVPPPIHIVEDEMPKVLASHPNLHCMMDGGVRRGWDILYALTFGIKAVGLGRVTAAGIGAGGYAGMRRAFEIVNTEFRRQMDLIGVSSIKEIQENGAEIRRQNRMLTNRHSEYVF